MHTNKNVRKIILAICFSVKVRLQLRPAVSSIVALLLYAAVAAADSTSVDSVAIAPPATEATAASETNAPLPVVRTITWTGMAMLRLREEIITNSLSSNKDSLKADGSFQIGYKIGAKAKPNDQVMIQFEIGNDWFATELATGIPGNYYTKRESLYPWFSLAYAQWDPGYMTFEAGIIPVKGSALMDLLGVSILFNKSYQYAAHVPWGIVTNFGQTGLKVGAPVLKDAFKLDLDLTSAIIEHRSAPMGFNERIFNRSAVELLLEAPMSFEGASVTPQTFVIPKRSYCDTNRKSDMEFGIGIDIDYKLNDNYNFRAGFGYAHNSNNNSYRPRDSVPVDPFDPSQGKMLDRRFDHYGTNSNIGVTMVLGPGYFDADFNVSTEKNNNDSTINDVYPFIDLKYSCWALNKNFIVMPRCRFFLVYPKVKYDSKSTIRPELIFNGSF